MRVVPPSTVEPQPDPIAPFRDRIASRCVEHDALFPKAVDLEARAVYRLHGSLHGSATHHRGIHSERRFREQTLGERHFSLADLARLCTMPTREAKAAALGALTEFALAIGYRLEPLGPADVEAYEAQAGFAEASGGFVAEFGRALGNDGRLDASEARELRPELEAAKRTLARAEALVVKAEERR